MNHTISSK
jgi:hypothetical protein